MMRNNNPNHTPLLDDAFVLGLRSNQSHYVQFLEIFGPAIMGYNEWHSISNCRSACTGSNLDFERWFTISDEAFILLVIVNYSKRWQSEVQSEFRKVSFWMWFELDE
jgi:hypothetical protein